MGYAKKKIKSTSAYIAASDISDDAIKISKANAREAGMEKYINFEVSDFKFIDVPDEEGVIILNPEYGDRLGDVEELKHEYKAIGDFFKQKCQGYFGYIFTGNRELAKVIGLRTKRKIEFYNGQIDCRLLEYELYGGSKKPNK